MRKITAILLTTALFCVAHASADFEASFEYNGETHSGNVHIEKSERVQRCTNRLTGSITLSTQEVLPVIGSEKVCGWVGPAPVANYVAILVNGDHANLKPTKACPPQYPIYCEVNQQCVSIWYCCDCQ